MNISSYKNYFILLCISLLIVITGIRLRLLHSEKIMLKFIINLNNNTIINQNDFIGFNTKIILLNKVDAISFALINYISKYPNNNNEKILIISMNNIDITCNNQLLIVTVDSTLRMTNIFNKFKLSPKAKNIILAFNEAGLIERTYSIRDYFQLILNRLPPKIGLKFNLEDITPAINKEFQNYQNGIYYITNNICSSCQQIKIYEYLEKMLISRGKKLSIVLSDNWEKMDLENLIKERNMNISAILASISLQKEINTWKKNCSIVNFAFVVIKSNDSILTFPMYDYNDYKKWKKYISDNYLYEILKKL